MFTTFLPRVSPFKEAMTGNNPMNYVLLGLSGWGLFGTKFLWICDASFFTSNKLNKITFNKDINTTYFRFVFYSLSIRSNFQTLKNTNFRNFLFSDLSYFLFFLNQCSQAWNKREKQQKSETEVRDSPLKGLINGKPNGQIRANCRVDD